MLTLIPATFMASSRMSQPQTFHLRKLLACLKCKPRQSYDIQAAKGLLFEPIITCIYNIYMYLKNSIYAIDLHPNRVFIGITPQVTAAGHSRAAAMLGVGSSLGVILWSQGNTSHQKKTQRHNPFSDFQMFVFLNS